MNTYNIPRNTKGEGRLFYIFSYKALIYTIIGVIIGWFFSLIFAILGGLKVRIIITFIFGFIGFAIGTFPVPKIGLLPVTEYIAGEKIDDCIMRYIKFRNKKSSKYVLFEQVKDTEKNNQTDKVNKVEEKA